MSISACLPPHAWLSGVLLVWGPGCKDRGTDSGATCPGGEYTAPGGPWFSDITGQTLVPDDDGEDVTAAGFSVIQVVDINGDGYQDMILARDPAGTDGGENMDKRVLLNSKVGTFADYSTGSGLFYNELGLLVFADLDGDGLPDAFSGVTEGKNADQRGIWLNNGSGSFDPVGKQGTEVDQYSCGGGTCTANQISGTFADFDQDGDLDLYVASGFFADGVTDTQFTPPAHDRLFANDGTGTFADATDGLGVQTDPLSSVTGDLYGRAGAGVSAGDYDNDGDIDLFVANRGVGRPVGPDASDPLCEPPRYWDRNLLWRNDGGLVFTDVGADAGVAATTRGPDGITDEDVLTMPDGCSTAGTTYTGPIGGDHHDSAFGDFDNDGDLDLIVGAVSYADYPQADPTLLLVNQGDGTFTEEATARGLDWRADERHAAFVDIDGDGRLDISTVGGAADGGAEWRLYHQQPDATFVLMGTDTLGVATESITGQAFPDLDNDGDPDVVLGSDTAELRILRNLVGDAAQWIVVSMVGTAPVDPAGARLTAPTSAGVLMRERTAGNGHRNNQGSDRLHLGLGADTCIGDVSVRWPDGTGVDALPMLSGRHYRMTQGGLELEEVERFE